MKSKIRMASTYGQLLRRADPGLYLVSLLVPSPIRQDLWLLYAFFHTSYQGARSQSPSVAARFLEKRQTALRTSRHRRDMWGELSKLTARHSLVPGYFQQYLIGLASDLQFRQPRTYRDLYAYCQKLAGLPAVAAAQVLGLRSRTDREAAERLGVGIRLTHILANLQADAAQGRIYIPAGLMREAQADLAAIQQGADNPVARVVLSRLAAQAEAYFIKASDRLHELPPHYRRPCKLIICWQQARLRKVERGRYLGIADVSLWRKAAIAIRVYLTPV